MYQGRAIFALTKDVESLPGDPMEFTPQNFDNITPAKWEAIKAAVKAKTGIDITTDVGANGAKGIVLSWIYIPEAQSLKITPVSRKFYDPSEEEIDVDLKALVEAA